MRSARGVLNGLRVSGHGMPCPDKVEWIRPLGAQASCLLLRGHRQDVALPATLNN